MTAPVQESMRERYDALRADLGKERSEPLGVVSRRDLQRFAVA